ncbi:hypothetical protein AWU82_29530 [Pseudomonas glycinae]|uniref:Uncharacterized protein n=1 Tax=Pseudomonas glycinae TaxID=1785145 RepID=A0ABM6QI35_9PSED|nr:hypothetical protein AWU82_29530 [Pseudomonas glycinae]
MGTPPWTLRVQCDAERHCMHSHAERRNDQKKRVFKGVSNESLAWRADRLVVPAAQRMSGDLPRAAARQ